MGYKKQGRGNAVPVTIILPKLALKAKGNEEEFYKLLDYTMDTVEIGLLERFAHICAQHPQSGSFMYKNGTAVDTDKCVDNVWETQKHNTLGMGYIGLHETCMALYGKGFYEDKEVYQKALDIVKYMSARADKMRADHKLNFSLYATPKLLGL